MRNTEDCLTLGDVSKLSRSQAMTLKWGWSCTPTGVIGRSQETLTEERPFFCVGPPCKPQEPGST